MSTCPQCYVGHCKVHRLQDSGKRSNDIKDQAKKLNALHDKLIQERLSALQGSFGNSGTSDRELASYREKMVLERERAEKRPRSELSGEAALLAASGMNGTTMKLMMGMDSEYSDDDGKKKKKEKKSKKHKKEKKHHKSKKEKKHKKKSSKSHKSSRHTSESSDSSDDERSQSTHSNQTSDDEGHESWLEKQLKKIKQDTIKAGVDVSSTSSSSLMIIDKNSKIQQRIDEGEEGKDDEGVADFDGSVGNDDLVKEAARVQARQALDNTLLDSNGVTNTAVSGGSMWKSMNLFGDKSNYLQR